MQRDLFIIFITRRGNFNKKKKLIKVKTSFLFEYTGFLQDANTQELFSECYRNDEARIMRLSPFHLTGKLKIVLKSLKDK